MKSSGSVFWMISDRVVGVVLQAHEIWVPNSFWRLSNPILKFTPKKELFLARFQVEWTCFAETRELQKSSYFYLRDFVEILNPIDFDWLG